jgi:hypothetical protein
MTTPPGWQQPDAPQKPDARQTGWTQPAQESRTGARRPFVLIMLLVAIAILAFLVITMLAGASSHKISGSFTLSSSDVEFSSSDCHGTGGHSDIRSGMGVTITDEAQEIVATTNLAYDASGSSSSGCAYTFAVLVPDAKFYGVEIGHRGRVTYSREELVARAWIVATTLGN